MECLKWKNGKVKLIVFIISCIFLYFSLSGFLWFGAFPVVIRDATKGTIYPAGWTNCKLPSFLFHLYPHYSSTLLVIMSVEKFIALYFPFKAKVVCTLRTAKWASLIIALFFIAFDAQFFYLKELQNVKGRQRCKYVNEKYGFVIERIKSIIYTSGPFTIMILLNLAFAFKFFMLTRKKRNTFESTSQALNKSATRGTSTLLLLSITFIVLTGPATLHHTVTETLDPILYNIFIFLQFLNHSINAVLYCIVGSKFRTELIKIIKCCGMKETPTLTSHATSTFTIDLNTAV